jgi:dipeptidyl aminopeptidase/acylaminoacyl peptidase
MTRKAAILFPALIFLVLLSSCSNRIREGAIIFTQSAGTESRIAAMDPDKPGKKPVVLSENFWSASSPDLSYDARYLLFSARKKIDDPSQVWMMDLKNGQIRQITSSQSDCHDPVWLPGGQIIFSRLSDESGTSEKQLYTCSSDGNEMKRITFDPYSYEDITVLRDGRLLARRSSDGTCTNLMVLRPDGTKNMIFYRAQEGMELTGRARETIDGRILFIEEGWGKSELVAINYNRPLHSRNVITGLPGSVVSGFFPSETGKLIISYIPGEKDRYVVGEFDLHSLEIKHLFENDGSDIIDPIVVKKSTRQRKLPSEVDMGVYTGQLLCHDVNFTGMGARFASFNPALHQKVEIVGRDSSYGFVVTEHDGSLYLKVVADTPFRIQQVDENGNITSGPSAWIYIRPNERRGCIGCHEDPEMVPDNRQPHAVLKLPVSFPAEIKNLAEKEIELE